MKAIALTVLTLASPYAIVSSSVLAAQPAAIPVLAASQGAFADGTYTGVSANAYYGNIQVEVIVKSGAIASFKLLDYPRHTNTSVAINRQALPILAQEVIAAQSARVDVVSGATLTSEAFLQSVASALPR